MKKYIYKIAISCFAKGFDANFYMNLYGDEDKINSKTGAFWNYIWKRRSKNRFPNEISYISSSFLSKDGIFSDFDISAYKFYNRDLSSKFDRDEDFILHYMRHGFKEERICRFPDNGKNKNLPRDEKWKSIFVTAEFLLGSAEEFSPAITDREKALELFHDKGIDRLWPINFDYRFDVKFIRENAILPNSAQKSDADLYREWLTEGFPAGVAPNERIFLVSYLGGLPFPLEFDWKAFVQRSGLSHRTTRSQALVALFGEPVRKILRTVDLMGGDAARLLNHIGCRALANREVRKAVALFEQSAMITPGAEIFCLLGDAHRHLGDTQKALDAYVTSANLDGAPIRTFLLSASIHAANKDFPKAFDMLRKAHRPWRKKTEFRDKLYEIVQLYFEHQSAHAHALFREMAGQDPDQGRRKAADDFLIETLSQIQGIYQEMDNIPAPTGGDPDGYIAILANDDLRQCSHYRIEQKQFAFESAGIAVKIFSHFDVHDFMDCLIGARAAIFYRVAATPDVIRAITYANSMDIFTYYEIDDLIFDSDFYPDPFASFEGQVSAVEYAGLQFGVPLFRYAMSLCRGSIASTPALARQMQAVTRTDANILIRNGLDGRNDAAIAMGANPIHREGGRVRIFYGSGTKAHNADFNRLLAPALVELMQRHPHIDLVIVGYLKLDAALSGMDEKRILFYPFISDISSYWSVLASCDISLAVLEPGLGADCKSEIKWLEAAVLRIPSIVSGTQTYREVIEHGVDGLIATSPAEWYGALRQLISDPALRAQIGANARDKALRHYDLSVAARTLGSVFGNHGRRSGPLGQRPLRLLICNVFFAPQSYGGATRVVEENVRFFREQCPDLEVGIFCSEEGAATPGRLTMGSEDGIAVYRLSVAQEADFERKPFNEANLEPFERVLDHFRPDMVHFHCIQRLTATIVEATLRRGLPYVVTLHDAWWISDHQFLVDEDGMVRLPTPDVLADCADRPNAIASIERRQRLASLLKNSRGNLSVSAPFADIYARAGVANIKVAENGVPSLGPIEHVPRADGRVALGHVGGRSLHKGAVLIEAALINGGYRNLHLTMTDGSLEAGQSIDTFWGTTPVTLTAPVPQAEVTGLYSRLNVLLAPSTWPESFGLVTREALHGGLWVVASDLGAIGQDVEEANGYVIDVSTKKALEQVLQEIDGNPGRYRNKPPASKRAVRHMCDQAAELHAIYREIAAISGSSQMQGV